MPRLIIQHDDRSTEYALTDDAVVIGRDPDCDLFFADRKLSRRHARFERDGSGFCLVDLESRNGSWVNEERIARRRLGHEDVLRLGSLSIRFQDEASPALAEEEATIYLNEAGGAAAAPVDADADADASSTVLLTEKERPDAEGPEPELEPRPDLEPDLGSRDMPAPPSFGEGGEDTSTRAISTEDVQTIQKLAADDPDDSATRMLPGVEPGRAVEGDASDPDETATRMALPSVAPADPEDTRTRMDLGAAPSTLPESDPADDTATKMIPSLGDVPSPPDASLGDESATRIAPVGPPPPPSDLDRPAGDTGERTVMANDTGKRRIEAGTVVFHGGPEQAPAPDVSLSSQANWDAKPLASEAGITSGTPTTPAPAFTLPAERSWTVVFALVVGTLVLFALAVLVLPLVSTSTRAIDEESRTKGRLMMELLAAVNENALGEGRRDAASIVVVESTPGVTGAYVLDTASRIVAPSARAGESFSIEGLDVPAGSVRSIRSGRTPEGELIVAGPITYRGRRVGVSLVTYRDPTTGAMTVLAIGCVLLAMGFLAAVLYGRRVTLVPLQELRSDVEALARQEGDALIEERAYREVSDIARAVNELASSHQRPRA